MGIKEFIEYVDKNAGRPGYATWVAIMTFLAGFLGTVLSDDIRAAFPLRIPGWHYPRSLFSIHEIHWTAVFFWLFVLAWFFLFWRRQKAETAAVSKLQRNASLTAEAVLVLPPKAFVDDFSKQVTIIRSNFLTLLSNDASKPLRTEEQKELEDWIRSLLQIVASLAQAYDGRPGVRYAANVAVYIRKADQAPLFPASLTEKEIRRFLHPHYDITDLEGVLFLPKELSASTDPVSKGAVDPKMEPLAFGIPDLEENATTPYQNAKSQWIVMPGAPLAFAKWNLKLSKIETAELRYAAHGVDDIWSLERYAREKDGEETFLIDGEIFAIEQSVLKSLEHYYKAGQSGESVRSFQAFPLITSDGTKKAFGTLNIHCNQPGFLGATLSDGRDRRLSFASVLSPFIFDIAMAVNRWENGRSHAP
jgi:hypothetical protein